MVAKATERSKKKIFFIVMDFYNLKSEIFYSNLVGFVNLRSLTY
jgi:hypothetical protein